MPLFSLQLLDIPHLPFCIRRESHKIILPGSKGVGWRLWLCQRHLYFSGCLSLKLRNAALWRSSSNNREWERLPAAHESCFTTWNKKSLLFVTFYVLSTKPTPAATQWTLSESFKGDVRLKALRSFCVSDHGRILLWGTEGLGPGLFSATTRQLDLRTRYFQFLWISAAFSFSKGEVWWGDL